MNQPYVQRTDYVVWIARGEALGRRLRRLADAGYIQRIWKAPSAGIHRLLHWIEDVTRHRAAPH